MPIASSFPISIVFPKDEMSNGSISECTGKFASLSRSEWLFDDEGERSSHTRHDRTR